MKASVLLAVGATAFATTTTMVGALAVPHNNMQNRGITSPSSIKLPFYHNRRRDLNDPEQTKKFAAAQHEYVKSKWGNKKVKREAKEAALAKRQIVGLSDVGDDVLYVAQLSTGTPAQTFDIILDTGSADFWLAVSTCTSADCQEVTLFEPSSSSTYQSSSAIFEVEYGSGAAEGTLASDTVTLAGYTVNSQTFGAVDQLASNTLDPPASGIMGMGFQQLASSGATPFWEVLAEGGSLKDNVFTFQLARESTQSSTSEVNPGGIFTLGELDSSQYSGTVNYIDLDGEAGYWTIPLSGYTINGASTTLSSDNTAAIDTGTSLIIAPPEVAQAIYAQIPNSQVYQSGTYAIPCSSNVVFSLTFGGQEYSINSADMLNGALDSSGQDCLGGIMGESLGQGAPAYIVGDTFLKNVFSVFQYSPAAVGFASLVGSSAQTAATTADGGKTQQSTTNAASSTSVSVVVPSFTSSVTSASTSTGTSDTPVAGSGLSAPVAASTNSATSPSITPAGESSSSSRQNSVNSTPLIAVCVAALVGFFAVL